MNSFEEIRQHLMSLGINLGLAISGFFGSLLILGKAKDWKQRLLAVCAGTLSATYLTPIAMDIVELGIEGAEHGFAFILGYSGLTVVEHIEKKYINKIKSKTDATNESQG